MTSINWKRVLLGGLVAGLVINVFEYVLNEIVLKATWEFALRNLGHAEQLSGLEIGGFMMWGFAAGIFAVWLYGAIRAQFGAGVRTAVIAGVAVWVLGYVLAWTPPIVLHFMPYRLMATSIAWGLVEAIVATIVGARLYRANGDSATSAAAA